jgi:hypothetical protein
MEGRELKAIISVLDEVYHVGNETKTYLNLANKISELLKIDFDMVQPDKILNDYFVPLKLLSSKIVEEDIKRYEENLDEYKERLRSYTDLGIGIEPIEPEGPEGKKEYKKVYINFNDIIIKYWFDDFDEEDIPIIVMTYSSKGTNIIEQMTINITLEEWFLLLESLNAYVRKDN